MSEYASCVSLYRVNYYSRAQRQESVVYRLSHFFTKNRLCTDVIFFALQLAYIGGIVFLGITIGNGDLEMWYKKYAVDEYMCQAKESIKDSWWCTAINDLQYGKAYCPLVSFPGSLKTLSKSLEWKFEFLTLFFADIKTWAIVVVILLSLFLVFDLIALFGTSKVRTLSIDVSWQRGGKRSKKSRSFWANDQQKKEDSDTVVENFLQKVSYLKFGF